MKTKNKETNWSFRPTPEMEKVIDGYCLAWDKNRTFVIDYFLRQSLRDQLPVYMRTSDIEKDNNNKTKKEQSYEKCNKNGGRQN